MVGACLMYVLEKKEWFTASQSGFRKRRGTIDGLLNLVTAIREEFMHKKHLVLIFFYIQKPYHYIW